MSYNALETAALQSGSVRIGIFLNLGTSPDPVRLWAGVGKFDMQETTGDPTVSSYIGFGQMGDVPAVQQFLNGAADHITFTLSGVSAEVTAVVGLDAPTIKHVTSRFGWMLFGDDWQPLGDIHWLIKAYGESIEAKQATDAAGNITRTVALTIGTSFTGRRRPSLSFYTDFEQQQRSSGDRFCERTIRYSRDVDRPLPIS